MSTHRGSTHHKKKRSYFRHSKSCIATGTVKSQSKRHKSRLPQRSKSLGHLFNNTWDFGKYRSDDIPLSPNIPKKPTMSKSGGTHHFLSTRLDEEFKMKLSDLEGTINDAPLLEAMTFDLIGEDERKRKNTRGRTDSVDHHHGRKLSAEHSQDAIVRRGKERRSSNDLKSSMGGEKEEEVRKTRSKLKDNPKRSKTTRSRDELPVGVSPQDAGKHHRVKQYLESSPSGSPRDEKPHSRTRASPRKLPLKSENISQLMEIMPTIYSPTTGSPMADKKKSPSTGSTYKRMKDPRRSMTTRSPGAVTTKKLKRSQNDNSETTTEEETSSSYVHVSPPENQPQVLSPGGASSSEPSFIFSPRHSETQSSDDDTHVYKTPVKSAPKKEGLTSPQKSLSASRPRTPEGHPPLTKSPSDKREFMIVHKERKEHPPEEVRRHKRETSLHPSPQRKLSRYKQEKGDIYYEETEKGNVVVAASLNQLISLLYGKKLDASDANYIDTFLFVHSLLISSTKLFEKLVKAYNKYSAEDNPTAQIQRMRIISVLKKWCKDFKYYPELVPLLTKFVIDLESRNEESVKWAQYLKISQNPQTNDEAANINIPKPKSKSPHPIITDPENLNLLLLNTEELARQMTLYDLETFKSFHPQEFLNLNWSKGKGANIVRATDHFSALTAWTKHEITSDAQLKVRVLKLSKLILLVDYLLELQNYHSSLAIYIGIELLKNLDVEWKKVSQKARNKWRNAESILTMQKDFQSLRKKFTQTEGSAIVPLSILMHDLAMIEEQPDLYLTTNKLNFTKMRHVYGVYKFIERTKNSSFEFETNTTIQEFLQNHLKSVPAQ